MPKLNESDGNRGVTRTMTSASSCKEHIPCAIVFNSSGGGISGTLDSHYFLGQGARGGVEREFIVIVERENNDISEDIGIADGEQHPGSYCGQDAYNDMFVTENVEILEQRRDSRNDFGKKCGGGDRECLTKKTLMR